jgi:hypothetical protein
MKAPGILMEEYVDRCDLPIPDHPGMRRGDRTPVDRDRPAITMIQNDLSGFQLGIERIHPGWVVVGDVTTAEEAKGERSIFPKQPSGQDRVEFQQQGTPVDPKRAWACGHPNPHAQEFSRRTAQPGHEAVSMQGPIRMSAANNEGRVLQRAASVDGRVHEGWQAGIQIRKELGI